MVDDPNMATTMNTVSRPFYFWSYLVAVIIAAFLSIGSLIGGQGEIGEEQLPWILISSAFGVYAFVVFAILIYKMWKVIPATIARTTPGKAVGFLFIPIFNFYWWFPALWGWTQDWNSYAAKSEGKLQRISEGLALTIVVISVIGGVIGTIASFAGAPGIGAIITAPNVILIPVFIFKVCNLLSNSPAPADRGPKAVPSSVQTTGLGIASLVLGIVSIILPYLGLVCGIVAIILAIRQRRVFREPLSMAGLITGIIGAAFWGTILTVLVFIIALG